MICDFPDEPDIGLGFDTVTCDLQIINPES